MMIYLIAGLVIGYVMGLIHKGIHIHVDKELPKQEGYNPSMVEFLPNEVKQYFHENNGQIKF